MNISQSTSQLTFDTTQEYILSNGPQLTRAAKNYTYYGYAIYHLPTEAVYLGITGDVERCFVSWYSRLRPPGKGPDNLSVAFRAIWTKRDDFRFHLTCLFRNSVEAQVWLDSRLPYLRQELGTFKVLNVDRSIRTRGAWMRRAPEDEHGFRFGTLVKNKAHREKKEQARLRRADEANAVAAQDEAGQTLAEIIARVRKRRGLDGEGDADPQQGVEPIEPSSTSLRDDQAGSPEDEAQLERDDL